MDEGNARLKTSWKINDDDFVERDGKMQELTVTITLCEYRNLVQAVERYDIANNRLQEENEKLKAENKLLYLQGLSIEGEKKQEPEATELTAALKGE